MNTQELHHFFNKHEEEYGYFERIETPLAKRPDLHAFLLLEQLCPDKKNIIGGAEHDIVYLSIDIEELAEKINESQIIELLRCGLSYYGSGSLEMFT